MALSSKLPGPQSTTLPKPNYRLKERLDSTPVLVFWETTKVCPLTCLHCRAESISSAPPEELTTREAKLLLAQVASFGTPKPTLILTGGDPLSRPDIWLLLEEAQELQLKVAISPAVSPRLNAKTIVRLLGLGVQSASISLDGVECTHDEIRGIAGHFKETLRAIDTMVEYGLRVQVNTTVMSKNKTELADVFALIRSRGVKIWEVFFLIQIGRGSDIEELTPPENEDVSRFLFEASAYDTLIRTVEAPFYRRVSHQLATNPENPMLGEPGPLYSKLSKKLKELVGESDAEPSFKPVYTRDGKGIVFISHSGSLYPSGFTPVSLGNIKSESLQTLYQSSEILRKIRQAEFSGACGVCGYVDLCGGSRARAFTHLGDPLAQDPGCVFAS